MAQLFVKKTMITNHDDESLVGGLHLLKKLLKDGAMRFKNVLNPDQRNGVSGAVEIFRRNLLKMILGWGCQVGSYFAMFLTKLDNPSSVSKVLFDSVKRRDYDEQSKKEESRTRSVCQISHASSHQETTSFADFVVLGMNISDAELMFLSELIKTGDMLS